MHVSTSMAHVPNSNPQIRPHAPPLSAAAAVIILCAAARLLITQVRSAPQAKRLWGAMGSTTPSAKMAASLADSWW